MAEGDSEQIDGGNGNDYVEYYSRLNVSKNASPEEIRSAYRRLCKTFHPDRYQDQRRQDLAADHFSRIQEAYKILSDPKLREIYDRKGKIGLEEEMAIVERTPIPSELYEEYEKLRALWEERTYIQNSFPTGTFKIKVDATRLIDGVIYDENTSAGDDEEGGVANNFPFYTEQLNNFPFYPEQLPPLTLTELYFEQSVNAHPTKSDCCRITGFGITRKSNSSLWSPLAFSSGFLFSLKRLLPNQSYFELMAIIKDNPGLALTISRGIGGGIFGTLKSNIVYVSGHAISFGGSCMFEKNLSNSTKGFISVNLLGNSTEFKLVHQYSSTTSLAGEICVGKEESTFKGVVLYQLIPKYVFRALMKFGTKGVSFEYGVDHEIARLTTVGASVELSPWAGVDLKLKLSRSFMNFSVKLKLSNFVGPAVLLYATSVPLALYGCIKAISLAPVVQKEWLEDVAKQKKEMTREVVERKARAESAVDLMQETFERVTNAEQAKHGLLITEAWYGKLFDQIQSDEAETKVIDVHIPLQCLVADSKLILHGTSKTDIPGFYDPCVGEKKYLRVRYEFRGTAHEVTIKDSEPLAIPRASHKLGNV